MTSTPGEGGCCVTGGKPSREVREGPEREGGVVSAQWEREEGRECVTVGLA